MVKKPRHRKVRFSRREVKRLEALPSASAQHPDDVPKAKKQSGRSKSIGRLAAGVVAIVLLVASGLLIVAMTGLGTGRIQAAAQSALSSVAGEDVTTTFGDARFTMGGPGLVALELTDARFETAGAGQHVATVDRLQIGVRLRKLLGGEIDLSGVSLSGVKLWLGGSGEMSGEPLGIVLNERGLVDPDLVVTQVFAILEPLVSAAGRIGEQIHIEDAVLRLATAGGLPEIRLKKANIQREKNGFSISAVSTVERYEVEFAGTVARDPESDGELVFEAKAAIPDFRWDYEPGQLKKPFAKSIAAAIELTVSGEKGESGRGTIKTVFDANDVALETVKDERQNGRYHIEATLAEGSGKIEIDQLIADIGRSHLNFNGAIQPAPASQSEIPVYRYEMVSDGSSVAAEDSPERAIGVLARLAGIINPQEGRLTADEIRVRTTGGEVIGNGALVFPGGKTPAVFLAINVPKMPVPHAKQLWPWKAADGARSWVLDNVYGGEVRDSWLEMSVVAGRFGDGIPFRPDEVSGHFEIFGTRFDTAGEIPPVRDANGTVDFQGTQVRIGLSSGTAYLPSGRTVSASDGEFEINAADRPLIGALEIDVAGSADGVAELATFKPIEASRYVDLQPIDFTGSVTGHVSGMIPLQNVPDPDVLSWRVALNYENLTVAKPFGGQVLSNATGTIVVDPDNAEIRAKGRLNEIPARLTLIEPLGQGSADRSLDLQLELDDAARNKLAPELNTMISGPVVVDVVDGEDGSRNFDADLTHASLRFPWAGWSKGPGISAKASFSMHEDGEVTRLTSIELGGKSFSLTGNASLRDGVIEKAQFDNVRLNREDSFNLSINRKGRGYQLNVLGSRIDARSLIKQFLADPSETGEGLDDTPVTLVAKADQVLGFGDETVSGVEISYSGTGTKAAGMQILATTKSGEKFAVSQETGEGGRQIVMQSADAGAILRFLNIYDHMQGGRIDLRLSAKGNDPLRGQIDARDFWIVNEPRLEALVSTAPEGDDGRSLNQAVKRDIDVSKAKFEQGFAKIEKGNGYLSIADGVLRGPLIGSTFQGQLFDADGRIAITGTFMPAYGLNRLFADIPLVGFFLGNGRDRGLIGITYKLSGASKSPRLQVNPVSAIAPGIFRQIFEFR